MKLIEPAVSLIEESNPYRKVEKIGRICYKSEDKITDTSYVKFFQMLKNNKHFAMLEHGWITYKIDAEYASMTLYCLEVMTTSWVKYGYYKNDLYVSVSLSHLYNPKYENVALFRTFRKLAEIKYLNEVESNKTNLSDYVTIADPPEMLHESLTFRSVHFVCDRGVSHELVRHRCAVAQESTRYCNYTKSKFGGEITFVKPSTWNTWLDNCKKEFVMFLQTSEMIYSDMINKQNLQPQQARAVLPNALKTEVVLTMSELDWDHFLDVRYRGSTGQPHPDMKVVAQKAAALLKM